MLDAITQMKTRTYTIELSLNMPESNEDEH